MVKRVLALYVFSLAAAVFLGCTSDSETPTSVTSDSRELVATVSIDSCAAYPPGWHELDALCGKSSVIRVAFDFVYPDVKTEYAPSLDGSVTRIRTVKSGPGSWEFSDPEFRSVLLHHFAGRPVKISASSTVGQTTDRCEIWVSAITGQRERSYRITLTGPCEMPVDADGFPMFENSMSLSGPFEIRQFRYDGYDLAVGNADAEIDNLKGLPVEIKQAPPVVARPTLTLEELRSAPSTLEFGDKRLAFGRTSASRPYLYKGLSICFLILEENLRDVHETRLDFVWVVHELGIWEPEVGFVYYNDVGGNWDTRLFEGCARDGPKWPIDTDVDIVAGFVDLNGDVLLMRITRTIFLPF